MSRDRLIILKFGGSVLRDGATLRLAVHEIYRWRRAGWRVLAVVSAFAGRTNELLRAASRTCAGADPHAVAALLATGEHHSAALLGLHLDRAGVRAGVLWPSTLGLVADGPALDAMPLAVDQSLLRAALERHGVVVVPGYAAEDRDGRPVVLGRGGSDLTALFLAHALGADRCRLIKDVDGLYDRDPARSAVDPFPNEAPRARRFATATFDDALATDGSIVQHKAVRFARRHGLPFELGRLNGTRPSVIGAAAATFAPRRRRRRWRVVLLGLGTVGGGVYELLGQLDEQFEIVAVAVRHPDRPRPGVAHELNGDALAVATCGADIVIETIGGCAVARVAVEAALRNGAHVVTANKALIAAHGRRLRALAQASGVRLCHSAAVGGSMPVLERLAAPGRGSVRSIRAVINGTTNFVLDRVAEGVAFDEAVRLAQRHGYAEADPSRDLSGRDAADKLCVLAHALGHIDFSPEHVACDELSRAAVGASLARGGRGGPLRHVATLDLRDSRPRAQVRLTRVSADDPLAGARGVENVAVIERTGRREMVEGKGAGCWPTAEAVVGDLLGLSRRGLGPPKSKESIQAAPRRRRSALSSGRRSAGSGLAVPAGSVAD